jgi:hypothetical protein
MVALMFGAGTRGEGGDMNDAVRLRYLRIALIVIGVLSVVGIYPLMRVWPSGFAWHTGSYSDYALMIVGVYATLGVFLILAARDPLANLSLIWFAVWSSIVHGCIMAAQALAHTGNVGHLAGDVPLLFIVAAVLAILTPRGAKARALRGRT